MNQIVVTVTPDGLKASMYVTQITGRDYPSLFDLAETAKNSSVVYGIDRQCFEKMVREKIYNVKVDIAFGTPPLLPTPGRIEILIDLASRGKPKALSDGRVDHREIGYVVNVKKHTPILKRIPPLPSKDGKSVLGTSIHGEAIPDVKLVPGNGTCIANNDSNILVADRDGAVALFPDGRAEVLDEKVIPGDIDYSTGNVSFSGNLMIKGVVRSGFDVEAIGNIVIKDSVEDATVFAGADLEIVGGATGSGRGVLKSNGVLKVRFLQNFEVESYGSLEVLEDIVHSTIWVENSITAKSIVGGWISAGNLVEVDSVGTAGEPRTTVDLGGLIALHNQKRVLLKSFTEVSVEIQTVKDVLFNLVKDSMDKNGILFSGSIDQFEQIKIKYNQLLQKRDQLQKDITGIDEKLLKIRSPVLRAKIVYPNTFIKAGAMEKIIKEKLYNVVISVDQNSIVIAKM